MPKIITYTLLIMNCAIVLGCVHLIFNFQVCLESKVTLQARVLVMRPLNKCLHTGIE